jgi:hypothetical protein
MVGTSTFKYIQIRLCITGFRLVAPICFVYLAVTICYNRFLVSPWIGLYTTLEASFLLFIYIPRRARMQKVSLPVSLDFGV